MKQSMRQNQIVDRHKLRRHVYQLAERIGERNVFHPSALQAAEEYISGAWQEQGYEVFKQTYEVNDVQCSNVEVIAKGSDAADQSIVIGAHYDSVLGAPGANDNGSGVASLLEISRLFQCLTPSLSLRFVAFVNEEPPFFLSREQGSVLYAQAARQRGDAIKLMVCLETIGYFCSNPASQRYPPLFRFFYPDSGDFIAFVSNFSSRSELKKFVNAFKRVSDFPCESVCTFGFVPGVSWSDHLSFWRCGYPAVMVTDTAFYRYPYYHTREDTADRVDYDALARLSQGLYDAIALYTRSV